MSGTIRVIFRPGVAVVSRQDYTVDVIEDFDDILRDAPKLLPAPVSLRPAEQVFVETYVRNGKDGAAAIRKAGLQDPRYDVNYVIRGLLEREDIQAAIASAEAMAQVNRDVSQYTREYFLHRLAEVSDRSLEANQFSSAISATKLQAQLLGLLEETVNIKHTVSARELPLAELRALVAKGLNAGEVPASERVIEG